jgi:hypothetical protein
MSPGLLRLRLVLAAMLCRCAGDVPSISPYHSCSDAGRCGGECVDLERDARHCGQCGRACTVAPGRGQVVACVMGTCMTSCVAGRGDCNRNPSDGCETPLDTVQNCGACGMTCAGAMGAMPACVVGRCRLVCNGALQDCDGNALNGCEADTRTSTMHCGGCDRSCIFLNAMPVCSGGTCTRGTCNPGFADCDSDRATCETATTTLSNCGGCGRACAFAHATAFCRNEVCVFGACENGFRDCDGNLTNGCEADSLSDVMNCGSCNVRCSSGANATPACRAGRCGVTCSPDYADCDGNAMDCEANLLTSTENCGACSANCRALTQTAEVACRAGGCVIERCNPAFADCDTAVDGGCEVPLRTPSNCNNCGDQCRMGTTCRQLVGGGYGCR